MMKITNPAAGTCNRAIVVAGDSIAPATIATGGNIPPAVVTNNRELYTTLAKGWGRTLYSR